MRLLLRPFPWCGIPHAAMRGSIFPGKVKPRLDRVLHYLRWTETRVSAPTSSETVATPNNTIA